VFKRFIGGTGKDIVLDYNLIFWFEAFNHPCFRVDA